MILAPMPAAARFAAYPAAVLRPLDSLICVVETK